MKNTTSSQSASSSSSSYFSAHSSMIGPNAALVKRASARAATNRGQIHERRAIQVQIERGRTEEDVVLLDSSLLDAPSSLPPLRTSRLGLLRHALSIRPTPRIFCPARRARLLARGRTLSFRSGGGLVGRWSSLGLSGRGGVARLARLLLALLCLRWRSEFVTGRL